MGGVSRAVIRFIKIVQKQEACEIHSKGRIEGEGVTDRSRAIDQEVVSATPPLNGDMPRIFLAKNRPIAIGAKSPHRQHGGLYFSYTPLGVT